MQPSGHAWAQVLQPVQRSSNQSRLVRARGEMGRVTSGNWMVAGGLTIRWIVTAMPDAKVTKAFSREFAHRLGLAADALQRRRIAEVPHLTFDREGCVVLTVPPAAAVRVAGAGHVDRRLRRASDRCRRAIGARNA